MNKRRRYKAKARRRRCKECFAQPPTHKMSCSHAGVKGIRLTLHGTVVIDDPGYRPVA